MPASPTALSPPSSGGRADNLPPRRLPERKGCRHSSELPRGGRGRAVNHPCHDGKFTLRDGPCRAESNRRAGGPAQACPRHASSRWPILAKLTSESHRRAARAAAAGNSHSALLAWAKTHGTISWGTPSSSARAAVPIPPWWTSTSAYGRTCASGQKGLQTTQSAKPTGGSAQSPPKMTPRQPTARQAAPENPNETVEPARSGPNRSGHEDASFVSCRLPTGAGPKLPRCGGAGMNPTASVSRGLTTPLVTQSGQSAMVGMRLRTESNTLATLFGLPSFPSPVQVLSTAFATWQPATVAREFEEARTDSSQSYPKESGGRSALECYSPGSERRQEIRPEVSDDLQPTRRDPDRQAAVSSCMPQRSRAPHGGLQTRRYYCVVSMRLSWTPRR